MRAADGQRKRPELEQSYRKIASRMLAQDVLRSFYAVWFAKTLADFEINDIAALPPLFCYNS